MGLRKTKLQENGESNNAELHALYSVPEIIRNLKSRRLTWAGHVSPHEAIQNCTQNFSGKT